MRRSVALWTVSLVAALVAGSTVAVPPAHADAAYTVQTLHFQVSVGADNTTTCDIIGDLYIPTSATPSSRVPAILTTNGWRGSKEDQAGVGRAFALQGYAVLAYSGLGAGGSSCKIGLDRPEWDGKAASQLVSFLGGAPDIAYVDAEHTTPVPSLDVIATDKKDHDGIPRTYDPRVGMVGGSYGGGIQFATASVDHRVDTIVPMDTWNDLSYAGAPNGTTATTGVSTSTSGAVKTVWMAGLLATAEQAALTGPNPAQAVGCPTTEWFCTAVTGGLTTGFFQTQDVAKFRKSSVSSFYNKIKVPVLLGQGQEDSLFMINEAVATYQALRAQGTPVKMIWHKFGHDSAVGDVPGDFSWTNPDLTGQYHWTRILNWFDRYLRNLPVDTGPNVSYFRDWINYSGSAEPAYAHSSGYPMGPQTKYYLSGDNALVKSPSAVTPGTQAFITPPAGAPTSIEPLNAVNGIYPVTAVNSALGEVENDLPGTFAEWTTPTLATPLDVAGLPTLNLKVDAPTALTTQWTGPAGQLVLFVKLEDVAPDGTASLIENGLVMPTRIPDVSQGFTVTLPGVVHRFEAGHQLRLVVSGGSLNYRGGLLPTPVTISADSTQVLSVPTV